MKDEKGSKPFGVRHLTGTGPVVEVGGQTYRFGVDSGDAKGRLEALIRAGVKEQMYAECDAMPPKAAERNEKRVEKLLDDGHYDTFGDGWQAKLRTPTGIGMLLASLLQEHHPTLTPADALRLLQADPRRVKGALRDVMPDFFRAAMLATGATPEAIAEQEPMFARVAAELAGDETPAPDTSSG